VCDALCGSIPIITFTTAASFVAAKKDRDGHV
jgi:hypothetical protein